MVIKYQRRHAKRLPWPSDLSVSKLLTAADCKVVKLVRKRLQDRNATAYNGKTDVYNEFTPPHPPLLALSMNVNALHRLQSGWCLFRHKVHRWYIQSRICMICGQSHFKRNSEQAGINKKNDDVFQASGGAVCQGLGPLASVPKTWVYDYMLLFGGFNRIFSLDFLRKICVTILSHAMMKMKYAWYCTPQLVVLLNMYSRQDPMPHRMAGIDRLSRFDFFWFSPCQVRRAKHSMYNKWQSKSQLRLWSKFNIMFGLLRTVLLTNLFTCMMMKRMI